MMFHHNDEDGIDNEGEQKPEAALARFLLELRARGLFDPLLLNAFERVPRERFLPSFPIKLLYSPISLPIAFGEEATDPFTLAHTIMHLEIKKGMKILEIGTGSGYFTAILAQIGAEVTSIERYKTLLKRANSNLLSMQLFSCNLIYGDGSTIKGIEELKIQNSYDRIIVNGSFETIPQYLLERLNIKGYLIAGKKNLDEAKLQLWHKDEMGQLLLTDCGKSKLQLLREGVTKSL